MKDLTMLDATVLNQIVKKGYFVFAGHRIEHDDGRPVIDGKLYEDGNWEQALRDFENLTVRKASHRVQ